VEDDGTRSCAPDLPRKLRWSIAESMRRADFTVDAITDRRVRSRGEHAR
jgi:hypothetical protein